MFKVLKAMKSKAAFYLHLILIENVVKNVILIKYCLQMMTLCIFCKYTYTDVWYSEKTCSFLVENKC